MRKCNVCGTEQKQIGNFKLSLDGENFHDIPQHNINLLTHMKCKTICDKCMDTYYKIQALEFDRDFIWNGKEYFSDGRNLD